MGASLAVGLGGLLLKGQPKSSRAASTAGPKHLVWVWQFTVDAEPNIIAARLRDNGLGIVLKTHDGLQWMSQYDTSPYAISGPAQAAVMANFFEQAGVPFHAWTVVQGVDPVREARMAADVLSAGARSIFLDVEPHPGFWRGTTAGAEAFGRELRRLQPNAHVVLSIDPRPWMLRGFPLQQFVDFSDEIAPQNYWNMFNTAANYERFAQYGFPVPQGGVTPEFIFDVSTALLSKYGLPQVQVGSGATPNAGEWQRYIQRAYAQGSPYVTVWRYGVTEPGVFTVLRDTLPRALPTAVLASGGGYVVQAGDTLSGIAFANGTSVEAIMSANGLSDPNYIYEGQALVLPGTTNVAATGTSVSSVTASGGRSYTAQKGDTIYGIAGRYGTTIDAIARANGIADPDMLAIGQVLKIP